MHRLFLLVTTFLGLLILTGHTPPSRALPVVTLAHAAQRVAAKHAVYFPLSTRADVPPQTTRISVASDDTQANQGADYPALSADGRFVAFFSESITLVPHDTNNGSDVFLHDRQTGQTTLISVAPDGAHTVALSYPALSKDGRYIAFSSNYGLLVHDRVTQHATRVADGGQPALSADGRFVAFVKITRPFTILEAGELSVFLHDRVTQQTTRVTDPSTVTSEAIYSEYPVLSADGRYVVFGSNHTSLVPGDTNGTWDVFVHDHVTQQTTRVSVASDGTQGNQQSRSHAAISGDGRYVAFSSASSNLVPGDTNGTWDVFVHDRVTQQTTRVSVASDGTQGNQSSWVRPALSGDGRYVAFGSGSSNLVPGDTNGIIDGFVHDRLTGQTIRTAGGAYDLAISDDGRTIAFTSGDSTLVPNDTNGHVDIYVHDRGSSMP